MNTERTHNVYETTDDENPEGWLCIESHTSGAEGYYTPHHYTTQIYDFLKLIQPFSQYRDLTQQAESTKEYEGVPTDSAEQSTKGNELSNLKTTTQDPGSASRRKNPFDRQMSEIADAAPETCQWIFVHPKYIEWRSETNASNMVLISGYGGLGKTVLTKAVKTQISEKENNRVIPFFCKNGVETRNSVISVLATWVYYLIVTHHSEIKDDLATILLSTNSITPKDLITAKSSTPAEPVNSSLTVDFLWSTLLKICKLPYARGYTFLLDALNECPIASQLELCNALNKSHVDLSFRILVTTRSESPISSLHLPTIQLSLRTLINDVTNFTRHEIDRREIHDQVSPELLESIIYKAWSGADGLFILVLCRINSVLSRIDDRNFRTNSDYIGNLMNSYFPPVLDYFGSMLVPLASSSEVELGTTILSVLLLEQTPIVLDELLFKVMLSRSNYSSLEDFLPDKGNLSDLVLKVRELCGPLLLIQEEPGNNETVEIEGNVNNKPLKISIGHDTARNFLTLDDETIRGLHPGVVACMYRINETQGHVTMAMACLRFLCIPLLSFDMVRKSDLAMAFLRYAIKHWYVHVRQSKKRVKDLENILSVFFGKGTSKTPSFYRRWISFMNDLSEAEKDEELDTETPVAIELVNRSLSNVFDIATPSSEAGIISLAGCLIDLNESSREDGSALENGSALILAIEQQKVDIVLKLLELGADPKFEDSNGFNVLHYAAGQGITPFFQKCIKIGIHLSMENLTTCKESKPEGEIFGPLFYGIHKQSQDALGCFKLLSKLCDVSLARTLDDYSVLHIAIQEGCIDVVRFILEHNLVDIDHQNQWGQTALHVAVVSDKSLETVRLLLDYKADADIVDKDGRTPLWSAICGSADGVALSLLNRTLNVDGPVTEPDDEIRRWTALHLASSLGKANLVRELLLEGADIGLNTSKGEDALLLAADRNHCEVVKVLLMRGAPIDNCRQSGTTPLIRASVNNFTNVIKAILEADAGGQPLEDGITALHMAAWCGNMEAVKCLMMYKHGKDDMNALATSARYTPLFCALSQKHSGIAQYLIEAGADVSVLDSSSWTTLHQCCNKVLETQLFDMIIDRIGSEFFDKRTSVGSTALMLAAEKGYVHATRRLLDLGADASLVNDHGETALICAGDSSSAETLRLLLHLPRCCPNQRDNKGRTALYWASGSLQDSELFRELCRRTNWSSMSRSGLAPLNRAILFRNKATLKVLLTEGMPWDLADDLGQSSVCEAAESEDPEFLQILLKYGADIERVASFNVIPWMLATDCKVPEVMKALKPKHPAVLARKANTILTNGTFEAARNSLELLTWITEEGGVSPCTRSDMGHSTLHVAAEYRNTDIIRYLLGLPGMGPLVNECTVDGCTPLMCAVSTRHAPTIRTLLEEGKADVTLVDHFGLSALDYARNHAPTLSLLTSAVHRGSSASPNKLDQRSADLIKSDITRGLGSFLSWISSLDFRKIYNLRIRNSALGMLGGILLLHGDKDNAITCLEHAYGLPSKDLEGVMRCIICRRSRRTRGFVCFSCPDVPKFCADCKQDENKMEAFGCATHDLIKHPSDGWYERDRNHVNDKRQTVDQWFAELVSKYTENAPSAKPDSSHLVKEDSGTGFPFQYPSDRDDVFLLRKSQDWSTFKEHLLKFPRDIWLLDSDGNNMVMLTIQDSDTDEECLSGLKILEFEGAVMLDRNAREESSVQWACRKGFRQSTTFLLSHFDPHFSETMVPKQETKKNYEANEAMSIMCERKWTEALKLAIERHFKWASYGQYELLRKSELELISGDEVVKFLLEHVNAAGSPIQSAPLSLLRQFERPPAGNRPDPRHHASNCVHSFSKQHLVFEDAEDLSSNEVFAGTTHREKQLASVIKEVSYLCGLGGLTSKHNKLFSSNLTTSDSESVMISFPSDLINENNMRKNISEISSALLQAIYCSQQNGMCCDGFTILTEKTQFSAKVEEPIVQIQHISLNSVIDFVDSVSWDTGVDSSEIPRAIITATGLEAASKIRSYFYNAEPYSNESRVELIVEVLQLLCLGFLSFTIRHCADVKLDILYEEIPPITLSCTGSDGLVTLRARSIARIGDVLKRKLLVFGIQTPKKDVNAQSQKQPIKLAASLEDILELWGSSLYITYSALQNNRSDRILVTASENKDQVPATCTGGGTFGTHWGIREIPSDVRKEQRKNRAEVRQYQLAILFFKLTLFSLCAIQIYWYINFVSLYLWEVEIF